MNLICGGRGLLGSLHLSQLGIRIFPPSRDAVRVIKIPHRTSIDPPLADFTPSAVCDAAVRRASLYDSMVFILPERFVKLLGQRSALTILCGGASHDGEEDTHSYDQHKEGSVRGERGREYQHGPFRHEDCVQFTISARFSSTSAQRV